MGGPWGWDCPDRACIMEIREKLKSFETMNWNQIERAGSHNVETERLCSVAKGRLRDIRQDDVDEIFSLRLTGRKRIWGVRAGPILRILWWDPDHEVCPSLPS